MLGTGLVAQDQGPPAPTPPVAAAPRGGIENIEAHRVEPLSYVRRAADIVEVDASLLDLSGDIVLKLGEEGVSLNEFARRAVMFGGLSDVGKQLTTIISDIEIARAVAAGADPADFELEEADQQRKYNEYLTLIKMQGEQAAGDDVALAAEYAADAVRQFEESIEQSVGMENFLNSLSAESRFEKVFLNLPTTPTPLPADYPNWRPTEENPIPAVDLPPPPGVSPVTWDALNLNENTRAMRQLVLTAVESGQPIPALFKGQITSSIRLGILQNLNLQWFFDDSSLPENVICRLGDRDITVANVWPLLSSELNEIDHHLILRELLTLRAMRGVLESANSWLDDEAARAAFRDHEAEYEGTLFPLSAIIMFQGYADLDRYREHYRYRAAYNAWRGPQITDEDLDAHYRRGGRLFFEKGNVLVDLAYKGTAEFGDEFGPDLFDQAEAALLSKVSDLETEQAWREAASALPKPAFRQAISKSDRSFERNQLRLRMSESGLSIFVRGYSMADEIFYRATPGEVIGPHRMDNRRHGWGAEVNTGVWMARVSGYVGTKPLDPMIDTNLLNARQDFLDLNYLYWSQECLEQLVKKASRP
ncbi:MAG: hypothetical protein DHS20C15_15640 [Planctomycetota bacterium]|nr:MAG: hypothetical protein DHS20C15_15640 [Planctomycetota bacterium]